MQAHPGGHLHGRKPWKTCDNRKSWRWQFSITLRSKKINICSWTEIWVLLTSNFNIFVVTSALGVVASAVFKRRQLWELTLRAEAFQISSKHQHSFQYLQRQALCLSACWSELIKGSKIGNNSVSEVVDFAHNAPCTVHLCFEINRKHLKYCFLVDYLCSLHQGS